MNAPSSRRLDIIVVVFLLGLSLVTACEGTASVPGSGDADVDDAITDGDDVSDGDETDRDEADGDDVSDGDETDRDEADGDEPDSDEDGERQTCQGCLIGGLCILDGESHSSLTCAVCDVAQNPTGWSAKPQGTKCRAAAGECDQAEVCDGSSYDCPQDVFVAGGETCGEMDQCDGAGSCVDCMDVSACTDLDWVDRAAECSEAMCGEDHLCAFNDATQGTSCGEMDQCDGAGSCVDCMDVSACTDLDWGHRTTECSEAMCGEDHLCAFNDAAQGTSCGEMDQCVQGVCVDCVDTGGCGDFTVDENACTSLVCDNHVCAEANDDTAACDLGHACTEDRCFNGVCEVDIVTEGCFIDGVCVTADASRTPDRCTFCNPTVDRMTWTTLDGVPCAVTDDGNPCTDNVCQNGACVVENNDSHTCSDEIGCTTTACREGDCVVDGTSEGCFIDNACVPEGAPAASNGDASCLICDPTQAWADWSIQAGGSCDDAISCTFDDTCRADGVCVGTEYGCGDYGNCNGSGTCTCQEGYDGDFCDQCAENWTGYPSCVNCDLDRDGHLSDSIVCGGDDCNDNDPYIHPEASDEPDMAFVDTNCDGMDGAIDDAVLVSTTGTDSETCGEMGTPCLTVTQAIGNALAEDRHQILIQAGTYHEPTLSITKNDAHLGLHGGYDINWMRGVETDGGGEYTTRIVHAHSPGLGKYCTLDIQFTSVSLSNLSLEVDDAMGPIPDTRSVESAYVVHARSSDLVFDHVTFFQGDGEDGAGGLHGEDHPITGQHGGDGHDTVYWFAYCSSTATPGGASGASPCENAGGLGGYGGGLGCPSFGTYTLYKGEVGDNAEGWRLIWSPASRGGERGFPGDSCDYSCGKNGGDGLDGVDGFGGVGAIGGFVDLNSTSANYLWWVGHGGGDGNPGTNGTGGGGGGGGAAGEGFIGLYAGAGGGGGGGGGCAALSSGKGGLGGGSSFGIFVLDGSATLTNCVFYRGEGGDGGPGGRGALGSIGAPGGLGGETIGAAWAGGDGGDGGDGGNSGSGGGGAGGHSMCVFAVDSTVSMENIECLGGQAGSGGAGGSREGTHSGENGRDGLLIDVMKTNI